MSAPIAERIPHAMSIHGHTRNDPYFWLRDDERKDPKILDYLNAENAYTKTMMEGPPLCKKLYITNWSAD